MFAIRNDVIKCRRISSFYACTLMGVPSVLETLMVCNNRKQATMNFKIETRATRVDVSETFSADQLWFRILSGLFQRCSLPENLWTALIQLWTALIFQQFRMTIFGLFFTFCKIFPSTSISRHIILVFSPVNEQKWETKIYFSTFVQAKYIRHT